MNKKKLLSLALILILLTTLSFGTLAWFSAEQEVENKFYIADSDDDTADEIFSVDVWEDKDNDGNPDDDDPSAGEGLVYEDILPGDLLRKEAFVENTGYYDQYIRVTVTISDAEAWINAVGSDFDVAKVFVGFDATKWTHIWNNLNGASTMPEDIVYVMYYKDILASGEKINIFDEVQIPTSLTQEQAAAFDGGFSIDVKAEAVQTENVVPEGTAAEDAAWAAFKTVGI